MDLLIDLRLTPHKFARQAQPARSTPRVFGGDEKLTTALLDRLAEHATVMTTKGKSYRMRKRASSDRSKTKA